MDGSYYIARCPGCGNCLGQSISPVDEWERRGYKVYEYTDISSIKIEPCKCTQMVLSNALIPEEELGMYKAFLDKLAKRKLSAQDKDDLRRLRERLER